MTTSESLGEGPLCFGLFLGFLASGFEFRVLAFRVLGLGFLGFRGLG